MSIMNNDRSEVVKIEFFYFEGCPHHSPALALLKNILKEEDAIYPIEVINVDSDQYAREIRFLGSPSIRINGKDIEESEVDSPDYGIRCRIYKGNDGPTGIPPEVLLRKSIAGAKGNSSCWS